jgi:hypothetical protein
MNKEKAPFRKVKVTFWDDEQISEDLSPEDRYFYLYLMTNPFTTQLGIYTITRKQIANHLGYNIEVAENLIKRFEEYHKLIKYNRETKEMSLLKWSKHNWKVGGAPVWDLIKKEIDAVKDKNLVSLLVQNADDTWLKGEIVKYLNIQTFDQKSNDSYHDSYNDSYHDTGYKKEEIRINKQEKNTCSNSDELERQFAQFWNLYGKKRGKQKCLTKFKKVLKTTSFDELMDGVVRYLEDLDRRNAKAFQKDPLTFLNGGHWEDEYEAVEMAFVGSSKKSLNKEDFDLS